MAEEPPAGEPSSSQEPRRKALTPELRRFLGTPRAPEEKPKAETSPDKPVIPHKPGPTPVPAQAAATGEAIKLEPRRRPRSSVPEKPSEPPPSAAAEESELPHEPHQPDKRPPVTLLRPDEKASRAPEMLRAMAIIGALVLLGLTFFVGMKFPYWKYKFLTARNAEKLDDASGNKFPGVSAEQLVDQALVFERDGKYHEAAERLIAAKHKNLAYRGILMRVGKMAYDQTDYADADKLFERAIAFGEDVDVANYFRGLIAVRRNDLAAAARFFTAAATAAPFVADYPFYLADTLRMDHHPLEAIPNYEHAALLAHTKGEVSICRFKIRMARLEAADPSKVKDEIKVQEQAGRLSVDWLMTAAALNIREAQIDEAIPLIRLARDSGEPNVFSSCARDFYFVEAGKREPRIAEVCQLPPI